MQDNLLMIAHSLISSDGKERAGYFILYHTLSQAERYVLLNIETITKNAPEKITAAYRDIIERLKALGFVEPNKKYLAWPTMYSRTPFGLSVAKIGQLDTDRQIKWYLEIKDAERADLPDTSA